MWLPLFLVPGRRSADAWTRHAYARLGASGLAGLVLVAMPAAVAALERWSGGFCLMRFLTRLPCPGCGITTSLVALGRGDVAASWRANPAGLAIAGLLAAQALVAAAQLWPRPGIASTRVGTGPFGPGVLSWLDRLAVGSLGAAWVGRLIGGF